MTEGATALCCLQLGYNKSTNVALRLQQVYNKATSRLQLVYSQSTIGLQPNLSQKAHQGHRHVMECKHSRAKGVPLKPFNSASTSQFFCGQSYPVRSIERLARIHAEPCGCVNRASRSVTSL